ncbi:S-layer homology domain-containing protein [Natroniella sulfidigena]|uniref:S-layer homology domain-containing protein n=1 Tax=Natroniella sulfidigena TaxID=723921 RepID=UPI002009DE0F|nr:S-layer homology domain-containing protein [Natroniella sulfidigena]MCK8816336.1 S-layer homology domain-containing protein [Natroniella sulfidigena]
MKKTITALLTLAMLVTLTVPALANPFADVEGHHWAYDALNQVAETGIIEGYEDGTYRGEEELTRYQVAVLTARMLDEVEADNNELEAEVVEAINQLATEFDQELAAIDSRLTDVEVVTISGETGVEYTNVKTDGDAVENPFEDEDDWDDIDAEDFFKQYADFNVNVEKDGVTADLDLAVVGNYFGEFTAEDEATNAFELDSISGEIATEDFVATVGEDQDLDWKDYLYDDEENIHGIIFKANDSTVAVGQDEVGEDDEARNVRDIALRQDNLFDLPLNVFAGIEDDDTEGRTTVAGLDTAFNLVGVDFTGEVATNDSKLDSKLARVGAEQDLGMFTVEGNYKYTNDFEGIQADDDFEANEQGYDIGLFTDLDKFELGAVYEDYDVEGQDTILTAEVTDENPYTLYGVDVFGNYEYGLDSEEEVRYVEANKDFNDISLAAIYDYDNTEDLADTVMSVAYAPEFEFANTSIAPYAELASIYDNIDNERHLNTEAGVDAAYEANDRVTLTGSYAWADKEARVDGLLGEKVTSQLGADYRVSDDATASINYETIDFTGAVDTDSFDAQSITGEVSVNF